MIRRVGCSSAVIFIVIFINRCVINGFNVSRFKVIICYYWIFFFVGLDFRKDIVRLVRFCFVMFGV